MPDEHLPNTEDNFPDATPETTVAVALPAFFQDVRLQTFLFFGAAFLLYANSLTHGFVLDDSALVIQNALTTKGFAGLPGIFTTDMFYGLAQSDVAKELVTGGRYRPVSQAIFAVLYQFFGPEPFAYHLIAVLLYALTCAVVYRTVLRLFGQEGYAPLLAWMAALLFVVHPIHTEVANNVKSCDETLALLLSLVTLNLALRAFEQNSWRWSLAAGMVFLVACFSKENAVVFTALIPLAMWMKMREKEGGAWTIEHWWAAAWRACLPLWLAFLAFFIVRGVVLDWTFGTQQLNVINNPFVKYVDNNWVFFSPGERFATIFYTMGKYVQLLFFPHPLTTDYYPRHIEIMTFADWQVWLSIVVNVAPLVYALWGVFSGKIGPLRFGILFYFVTIFLVSNILFPTGVNMAERFAFMPSVGFCLAIAGLICYGLTFQKLQVFGKLVFVLFCAGCLAFAARTFVRNFDFADSKTLLFKDIQVSANSTKGLSSVGGIYLREALEEQDSVKMSALAQQAIPYFDRALEIHPTYAEAFFARGTAHYFLKNYPAAIEDLRKCAQLSPGRPEVVSNLAAALFEQGKEIVTSGRDPNLAIQYLLYANQMFPNAPETLYWLGVSFLKAGKLREAIKALTQLNTLQPGNADTLAALAEAYRLAGDQAKANEINNLLNNVEKKE